MNRTANSRGDSSDSGEPNAADIVDRPLVHELQVSDEREADVRLLFKRADQDPKILIVTDKLLTGYDAPANVIN